MGCKVGSLASLADQRTRVLHSFRSTFPRPMLTWSRSVCRKSIGPTYRQKMKFHWIDSHVDQSDRSMLTDPFFLFGSFLYIFFFVIIDHSLSLLYDTNVRSLLFTYTLTYFFNDS